MVREGIMADDDKTQGTAGETPITDDATATAGAAPSESTTTVVRGRAGSRVAAAEPDEPTVPLDTQLDTQPELFTCAGCGKLVELDVTETIGTQPTIKYHSCNEMKRAVHDWFLALMQDQTAPQPELTK